MGVYKPKPAERSILRVTKHRAKKLGLPYDLDVEDIVIPETCPVLGIRLVQGGGRTYNARRNSPSIDRIRPELGYVKGNVRIISMRANALKSDASVAELEAVLADLKELRQC